MNKLIFKNSTVEYDELKNGDLKLFITMNINDGYNSRKAFNNGFTIAMTSIKRKLQANLNKIDVGRTKIGFFKKVINSKRAKLKFEGLLVEDIKIISGPEYIVSVKSVEGDPASIHCSMLKTDWTLFKVVHYKCTGEKDEQDNLL